MKLIQRIRDSRTCRLVFVYLLLNISFEIAQPTVSLALTSGPSQPEVQSFEPVGTTDMVDVFTGDFNYNIPLMNIPGPNGGYPINLAYHAGISMDDEASWAGLGWNINNGALVRNMRGLPDDFDSEIDGDGNYTTGDFIERKLDRKESVTMGISIGSETELFGSDVASPSWQLNVRYNNYRGLGYSVDYGTSLGNNSNFQMGLSLDSDDGLGVNVSYSFDRETKQKENDHYRTSIGFNGKRGLSASLDRKTTGSQTSGEETENYRMEKTTYSSTSRSSSLSYSNVSFSPSIGSKINTYNIGLRFFSGEAGAGFFQSRPIGVYFSTEDYDGEVKAGKRYPVLGYENNGLHSADDEEFYTQDFTRQNDGVITRQTPVLGHSYYTNDAYSFTGQGIGGYFRGRRSDIGRIHDPKLKNEVFGLNASLEISPQFATANVHSYTTIGGVFDFIDQAVPDGKKVGIGLDLTYGWNTQGAWNHLNGETVKFKNPRTVGKKENVYYQVHGQPTVLPTDEMDHIGGEAILRPHLTSVGDDLERGIENFMLQDERQNNERVVRNTLVHNFHNKEMEKLPEFSSQRFYRWSSMAGTDSKVLLDGSADEAFDRSRNENPAYPTTGIKNHNGGYKVLQEDGGYYVYGLPAYNTKDVNSQFSVSASVNQSEATPFTGFSESSGEVNYKDADGTDKYLNKTTQSPYAHSYLLTAIYGADYVDLTQNGPTDDDLGYWVKFDYVRYAENYKWRAPYYGALLNKGAHHTAEDDKGSYAYGEKELWYLARIQTKTHVSVFHLSERDDNAESTGEFSTAANPAGVTNTGLKVDKISLYTKQAYSEATSYIELSEVKALQEVHFQYDYSLCKGVSNNQVDGAGKLTLKALWFTAQGSAKGTFNKYKFHYDYGDPGEDAYLANPDYDFNRLNSWGGFKPGAGSSPHNKFFPYADQFNQWPQQGSEAYHNDESTFENEAVKEDFQHYQDQFASAWCLKRIELPSGGEIRVDYESDDYAYVQDQEATQMFKITDVNDMADGLDKLYDEGLNEFGDARSRRIYFKLEYPIPSTATESEAAQEIYDRYVKNIIKDENGDRNLYFKSFIELKDLSNSPNDYEAVSGYLPLEDELEDTYYNYGVGTATSGGYFTHGFVTVKQTRKKDGEYFDHHPMSLLAWQYMQTNTPKLMHDFASYDEGSNGNFVQQIANVANVIPSLMESIGAIRGYARSRNFAKKIDLDRSVIRLCSPDKKKFGGGHRVKKISITDSWGDMSSESDRTYGTEYDYTMFENGEQISSGVAQYEPSASGDENALKYPLHFFGKNTFVSNNNLFAEHPFNEDLFPGASVGYRKVTVKSLNTGRQLRNSDSDSGNDEGTAHSGGTGGVTVYSFYTAKEFPTIVEYTTFSDSDGSYKNVLNLPIPIPFIGAYYRQYYHASQGFKIELNDMHGKPRSIETFELSADYQVIGNPITSTTYEYQTKNFIHNGNNVLRLHNKVRVVSKDNPTVLAAGERDMGVEYDMYTDQRQTKSHVVTAGGELNLDFAVQPTPPAPPIPPVPSFWPSFTTNKTLSRTYVTNKVIFKTGILKRTVTRDLQSNSSSEIVAYDELSGQPLVTKGTNEFGDEIYSYNIPAYWNYDRMGHASKNINYTFQTDITTGTVGSVGQKIDECPFFITPTGDMLDMLVRGDEILFTKISTGDRFKAYYADLIYSSGDPVMLFYTVNLDGGGLTESFYGDDILGRVVRSGRRNHYSTIAGSYITKGNVFDNIDGTVALTDDGLTTPEIQNVIGASASLFRDDWDNSLTVSETDGELVANPFLSGHSGIWRPYKSYVYAGPRLSSADNVSGDIADDPNLRNDGVMLNVPMFSWDIGNIEEYKPEWEWASEISRYNTDSYEVENTDRLGIKSSALFGLGHNLSIAVGGNAGYHELGTMDFERKFPGNSPYSDADPEGLTNMVFYKGSAPGMKHYISETVRIKEFFFDAGSGKYIAHLDVLPAIFNTYSSYINGRAGLGLTSRKTSLYAANIGHFLNGTIESTGTWTDVLDGNTVKVKLILDHAGLKGADNSQYVQDGEKYYGRATFLIDRPGATLSSNSGVDFVNTKAHTGKKSMKLTANNSFLQKELMLKTGSSNKYVLSLWVSRDDDNQYRFTTTGSDLITLSQVHPSTGAVTSVPSGTLKYTCSKVIEGWQKIDITFETNVSCGVLKINFAPGANALYVDDIRISPFTGGISTNVYDSETFRLRATLNADNYATFYYYDEQGNLVLRKQETENGIVTLNEARGHVRKQN